MATLRFLFDENISRAIGLVAAQEGFDIAFQTDRVRGAADGDLLAAATVEDRIVVTEDTGFGQLVFAGAAKPKGVVLIRIAPWKQDVRRDRFRWLLRENGSRLAGNFVVLGEDNWRVRPIGDG